MTQPAYRSIAATAAALGVSDQKLASNAVVLALAAMVRADIARERVQRAKMRVVDGGKR